MVASRQTPKPNQLSENPFVKQEAERFAASLVMWREANDVTQQALAERIGISTAAVSAVEIGRSRPSFELLAMLRKEMGLRSLSL